MICQHCKKERYDCFPMFIPSWVDEDGVASMETVEVCGGCRKELEDKLDMVRALFYKECL